MHFPIFLSTSMKSFGFRADMYCDYTTHEAVKTHIAPTGFFHQRLQRGRSGEIRERLRQVVVFFKGLADNGSKERGELVKVEMKEGAEYPAGRVTDFQADDSSSRPHHAQHLAEPLWDIAQVAHCESGTAAVDAVVGQIDVLGIASTQFDPVLQAQAVDLSASNLQHLRRDVHTDHTRSRSGQANNRDREVRRTGAQVKPHFAASQGQVARGNSTPALVQP